MDALVAAEAKDKLALRAALCVGPGVGLSKPDEAVGK
jgi:hypothetical protein